MSLLDSSATLTNSRKKRRFEVDDVQREIYVKKIFNAIRESMRSLFIDLESQLKFSKIFKISLIIKYFY